jgi:hypothetical protein
MLAPCGTPGLPAGLALDRKGMQDLGPRIGPPAPPGIPAVNKGIADELRAESQHDIEKQPGRDRMPWCCGMRPLVAN